MIRHLTRLGDQYAIVIDRAILELLGIDESTALDVRTDGIGFQIVPAPQNALPRTSPAPPASTPVTGAIPRRATPGAQRGVSTPPAPPVASTAPAPVSPPTQTSAEGLAYAVQDPPSQTMEVRTPDEVDERSSSPKVVVLRDGEFVLEHPFTTDEIVVGRNKQAHIPLDDRALSRDHAKFSRRGASFWVADLGSANGTYVGGERITEPRLLHAGDVVVIGLYQLRIDGVEQVPTDTPVLTINGPDGQHRFAMVGADIVVGRADDCDVAINNRSISRRHLQISRGASRGTFVAYNISGHNVVKVDGAPIAEPTEFSLGSELEIGDFTITMAYVDIGGEKKESTMVIDRTALAKAAYVDGDYGDANAGGYGGPRR
jgi:pSer/pThr/pTyr-binding forkhead associated (FHA) protein